MVFGIMNLGTGAQIFGVGLRLEDLSFVIKCGLYTSRKLYTNGLYQMHQLQRVKKSGSGEKEE